MAEENGGMEVDPQEPTSKFSYSPVQLVWNETAKLQWTPDLPSFPLQPENFLTSPSFRIGRTQSPFRLQLGPNKAYRRALYLWREAADCPHRLFIAASLMLEVEKRDGTWARYRREIPFPFKEQLPGEARGVWDMGVWDAPLNMKGIKVTMDLKVFTFFRDFSPEELKSGDVMLVSDKEVVRDAFPIEGLIKCSTLFHRRFFSGCIDLSPGGVLMVPEPLTTNINEHVWRNVLDFARDGQCALLRRTRKGPNNVAHRNLHALLKLADLMEFEQLRAQTLFALTEPEFLRRTLVGKLVQMVAGSKEKFTAPRCARGWNKLRKYVRENIEQLTRTNEFSSVVKDKEVLLLGEFIFGPPLPEN